MVVSGLTLTDGAASRDQDPSFSHGGAVHANGADLTLEQVVVADSQAADNGGGVSVEGGTLLVAASTITGNSADNGYNVGGGIHFDSAGAAGTALEVRGSIISENAAGPYGGGISALGPAPVTVTGSTISDNTASYTFSGMEVYIVEGSGGGVAADHLTVVGSRVIGNEAGSKGGGLSARSVVVSGSTIADNVAGDQGGGLHVSEYAQDEFHLDSSTVTGNRAPAGGGLYVGADLPVDLRMATLAANVGGGLFSNGEVALQGTVIGMNAGGDLAGQGSATLAYSLVQDPRLFPYTDLGGSIIGEDPLVGPLADHGGATETMLPASNSPVIDQGGRYGATSDQRGFPRPADDADTPNAVDGSDIGSVELTDAELAGPPQVASTARPTIAGLARVGETLHADGGGWEPDDVTLSYQWLRNDVPVPGATSASYTLTSSDLGRYLYGYDTRSRMSVRVTAAADGHRDGTRTSDHTAFVGKGILRMDGRPRVEGRPEVGSVLWARPWQATVAPRPRSVLVEWFLDGRSVGRASGDLRFRLRPQSRGQRVEVSFTYRAPKAYRSLTYVVEKRRRVR